VEQEDQDVQGAMESPYRGRSYWEREEELNPEFPSFFSDLSESWRRDSV
jgi:hypothetical protein